MKTELCEFLSNLPKERTREYELSMTEYVLKNSKEELSADLEQIVKEHNNPNISYNAFYCLNIIYRHAKDFFKVSKLFEMYTKKFANHITFDHLKVLFEIESSSMYDFDEVLNVTFKDSELFDNNAGFVHLFADVFITIFENGHIRDVDSFLEEWYHLALNAVNKAIELDDNYAKYYCTKARMLCVVHEYDEAMNYINKAISIERSDRQDYMLRICNYQYYKMMINVNKKLHYLTEAKIVPTNNPENNRLCFNDVISYSEETKSDSTYDLGEKNDAMPKAYSGNMQYAFVSYSHANTPEAYKVISLLQREGLNVWFDEGIEIGVEYAEYIAEKLSEASAFILMITPDSINSEFVRKELQMALDLKLKPICVYLKETMLSPGMEIQLNIYEHINYFDISEKSFLDRLVPAIRKRLKTE